MQHQTDDMDDLFRKAAKDYPLKAEGADWDKIHNQLQAMPPGEERRGIKRRALALWLLLPVLIAGSVFLIYNSKEKTETTAEKKPDTQLQQNISQKNVPSNANRPLSIDIKTSNVSETNQLHTATVSGNVLKQQRVQKLLADIRGEKSEASPQTSGVVTDASNDVSVHLNNEKEPLDLISSQITGTTPEILNPDEEIQTNDLQFDLKKSLIQNNKKFYVGLISGVDATTIKFQKLEKMSHDFGVLVGYNFSERLAVETGVFSGKKYYYTEGAYFNTKNIYLPANSKLLQVEGNCRMLEFPLTVRYNFKSAKKLQPFATAGVTSYMMKRESYDYLYQYASGNTREVYKYYKNSSDHLAATVNFSAGYTMPAGKIIDLRIEPYISLPLKGVGMGSLPFTSAGIHVGVSKKLF